MAFHNINQHRWAATQHRTNYLTPKIHKPMHYNFKIKQKEYYSPGRTRRLSITCDLLGVLHIWSVEQHRSISFVLDHHVTPTTHWLLLLTACWWFIKLPLAALLEDLACALSLFPLFGCAHSPPMKGLCDAVLLEQSAKHQKRAVWALASRCATSHALRFSLCALLSSWRLIRHSASDMMQCFLNMWALVCDTDCHTVRNRLTDKVWICIMKKKKKM